MLNLVNIHVCVCILHLVHGNIFNRNLWSLLAVQNCSNKQQDEAKQMPSSVYTNTFYNHRNNKLHICNHSAYGKHILNRGSIYTGGHMRTCTVCAKSDRKGYLKTSFHDWRGGSVKSGEAWNKMLAKVKRDVCEWVSVLRRQKPRTGGGKLLKCN